MWLKNNWLEIRADDEVSLAYACTQTEEGTLLDYAIHFQSRTDRIDRETFEFLYDLAGT